LANSKGIRGMPRLPAHLLERDSLGSHEANPGQDLRAKYFFPGKDGWTPAFAGVVAKRLDLALL
jgi:hypothetical protein